MASPQGSKVTCRQMLCSWISRKPSAQQGIVACCICIHCENWNFLLHGVPYHVAQRDGRDIPCVRNASVESRSAWERLQPRPRAHSLFTSGRLTTNMKTQSRAEPVTTYACPTSEYENMADAAAAQLQSWTQFLTSKTTWANVAECFQSSSIQMCVC
jgi:hypothetical protein